MKCLNKDDLHTASVFIKYDRRYHLMCWYLMASKHKVGRDMNAVMFFI